MSEKLDWTENGQNVQSETKYGRTEVEEHPTSEPQTIRESRIREITEEKTDLYEESTDSAALQEIYRTLASGMNAIDVLRPMSDDRGFRNLLLKEYKEYNAVKKELELYAVKQGITLKEPLILSKWMLYVSANVNAMRNKSNQKLAEIMIQGLNMGIIALTKVQNRLQDHNTACAYADRTMYHLQQNLEDMKLFL